MNVLFIYSIFNSKQQMNGFVLKRLFKNVLFIYCRSFPSAILVDVDFPGTATVLYGISFRAIPEMWCYKRLEQNLSSFYG